MRIAVTGADGFIGRYLLPILLAQGHQVAAVSRRAGHPPQPGLSWLQADLLDAGQVRQAMAEAEAECLIHLAWFVEHGRFWTAAENFAWCDATAGLLAAFNEFGGKRAVLAGTCAEYDWNYGYCIEGKTPTVPATLYGKCKMPPGNLPNILPRQRHRVGVGTDFTPYGPGEPVGRFVPSVLSAMGRGEVLKCSHGRQFRDFLHASDVAAAFAHLAANTPATGVFNIASGEPMRLADIVAICAGLFEAEPAVEFGAVPVAEYDPLMLVGCADKLAATGWAARISIRDGLADYRIKINELKGSE